jgi:hypothetical protein
MTVGSNLMAFVEATARIRQYGHPIHPIEVATADLELEQEFLRIPSRPLRRTPQAEPSLWKLAGIPISWAENCSKAGDSQLPADVWNLVVQRLSEGGAIPDKCLVYVKGDEAFNLSPRLLQLLTFGEVLDAIESTLPRNLSPDELKAHRPLAADDHFELNIVTSKRNTTPREGDVVEAGISIFHAATDQYPTQVTPYLRRCVCNNGMIVVVHPEREGPRIRRIPRAGGDRKKMVDQLKQVLRDAWDHVDPALEQFRSLTEQPLSADGLLGYLEQIRARYALTNQEIGAIDAAVEADERGRTNTLYDVANGISWVGTHIPGLDLQRRRQLRRAGGDVAVRHGPPCLACGSIPRGNRRRVTPSVSSSAGQASNETGCLSRLPSSEKRAESQQD